MPLDEQIMKKTDIQKKNKPIPRCKQERSKIPGENSGKQQTKNGNTNHRKNGHNTLIGHGLDKKIQTDNR